MDSQGNQTSNVAPHPPWAACLLSAAFGHRMVLAARISTREHEITSRCRRAALSRHDKLREGQWCATVLMPHSETRPRSKDRPCSIYQKRTCRTEPNSNNFSKSCSIAFWTRHGASNHPCFEPICWPPLSSVGRNRSSCVNRMWGYTRIQTRLLQCEIQCC